MKISIAAVTNTIASWNIKSIATKFVIAGVIITLVTSVFWYRDVYMSDERRFWSAIDNSMATTSVVRTITNGGSGNRVVQDNRFYFTPQNVSESKVTFTNRSATVNTSVVTEGINTLDSQYSRYISFDTNDTREDGSIPNLDSVLGEWAGETVDAEELDQARLNYVSELVTLVIFGNFNGSVRSDIVSSLRDANVYEVTYSNLNEDIVDDEKVTIYPVSVGLRAYAEQLQKSFEAAGLGDFPPLSPENYREDARLNAQIAVRKRDNTIVSVMFGDRVETYSNYGVLKNVELPQPSFTPEELEERVQSEIQS